MISAKLLSNVGRVALLDMDFLNPLLHQVFPQKTIKAHVNDFLFGEASLDDVLVDVGQEVNARPKRFWVGYMNPLEGARKRMAFADTTRDKRIAKALENVKWEVEGRPLDFVVLDTAPWSSYLIDIVSIISNVVFFVIRPSRIELRLFLQRYTTQFSHMLAKVIFIINACPPADDKYKSLVEELRDNCPECDNIVTVPYYQDLASGPSKELLKDTSHRIYNDLQKALLYIKEIAHLKV
ncbi:MAG: hypothetical protein RMJ14_00475 [Nitrososphaerota archaeon]|nr:hypothetical protein [Aigarchaeota archaeon]MDW8076104.1 hypothetical protein [Nitrososphaerota archaeon]